jgi:hypothetical protein
MPADLLPPDAPAIAARELELRLSEALARHCLEDMTKAARESAASDIIAAIGPVLPKGLQLVREPMGYSDPDRYRVKSARHPELRAVHVGRPDAPEELFEWIRDPDFAVAVYQLLLASREADEAHALALRRAQEELLAAPTGSPGLGRTATLAGLWLLAAALATAGTWVCGPAYPGGAASALTLAYLLCRAHYRADPRAGGA